MKKYHWWKVYVNDLGELMMLDDYERLPLLSGFGAGHAFDNNAWSLMFWMFFVDVLGLELAVTCGVLAHSFLVFLMLFVFHFSMVVPHAAYAMYPRWLKRHGYVPVMRVWARTPDQASDLFLQHSQHYLMDLSRNIFTTDGEFQVLHKKYYNDLLTTAFRYPQH